MAEPEEDFATMFEASLQARRFERGETIEGTIVAIGPEVAFVNVGGKGEAEVEVLEVDPAGRRIRLSRKAVLDAQGRDELRDYAERTEAASSHTLGGSLGDKLRGALEPRKK